MEISGKWLLNILSALAWCWLYIWATVRWPKKSAEFSSRVVTFLHGSVASVSGLWLCGLAKRERCFETPISTFTYAMMVWSWGYFAFDIFWCLLYWPRNVRMLFHHVCSLAAITAYMGKNNSGCIYPCTIALMEITNPLLQTRWFLRDAGYSSTLLFTLVEVTYLLIFIFLRAVLGTYLVFKVIKSDKFAVDDKLLTFLLYGISILFVQEILGYALYKYRSKIVSMYTGQHIKLPSTSIT